MGARVEKTRNDLADTLITYRGIHGLSQAELSKKSGVPAGTIGFLENRSEFKENTINAEHLRMFKAIGLNLENEVQGLVVSHRSRGLAVRKAKQPEWVPNPVQKNNLALIVNIERELSEVKSKIEYLKHTESILELTLKGLKAIS